MFPTQLQASASPSPSSEASITSQQQPLFQKPTFQLPSSATDTQKASPTFAIGAPTVPSVSPFPQRSFDFGAASATQQASSSSSAEVSTSPISPLTKTGPESKKTDITSKFERTAAQAFTPSALKSPQSSFPAQQPNAEAPAFKNPFQNLTSEAWKQASGLREPQLSKNDESVSSVPAKSLLTEEDKSFAPQTSLIGGQSKTLFSQPSLPSSGFPNTQASSSQKSPAPSLPANSQTGSANFTATNPANLGQKSASPFPTNFQATSTTNKRAQVRSTTLEKLTQELVCGDYGLLEQLTEHLMEGIFEDSVRIVKKERKQRKDAKLRSRYLGTKYLALWRAKAWKLHLKRRAIHRRKNLSKSVRELTQHAEESRRSSIASDSTGSSSQANGSIPLGSLLAAPHHHNNDRTVAESSGTKKRKSLHDDDSLEQNGMANGDTPTQKTFVFKKPKTSSHRRTQTMGISLPSFPSNREAGSPARLRASLGETRRQLGGADSPLSESMLKRARQVIGRTDTTRTDYFRLKARGINPNTPLIPETRKRNRALTESVADPPTPSPAAKALKLSPPTLASLSSQTRELLSRSQSTDTSTPSKTTHTAATTAAASNSLLASTGPKFSAEEESLFAQARKLREALAEDEAWFRREREAIEAKTKAKEPPPRPESETEKQRKLREWQGTPSKTSVRLEKTNAGGLLPNGWKNGVVVNGDKKGKGKERETVDEDEGGLFTPKQKDKSRMPSFGAASQMGGQQLRGFAALANGSGNQMGMGFGMGSKGRFSQQQQHEFGTPSPLATKGASVEDAIEL